MAPPSNIQSIALQLEKVRKNVPTAYEQEHIFLDLIESKSETIDASTRNIRLPQLIRPGGKASQGTADFDDMGRGSGSTWDVGRTRRKATSAWTHAPLKASIRSWT